MVRYIEKAEKMTLQLIALRGITVFPSIPQSVEISDKTAKKACILAKEIDEPVLLVSLKDITNKKYENIDDFVSVGTAAKVKENFEGLIANTVCKTLTSILGSYILCQLHSCTSQSREIYL